MAHVPLFLENHLIFFHEVFAITLMVNTKKKFTSFLVLQRGIFGPTLVCVSLFFRTVQYFLMKFCTDGLSITLTVTTSKKFFPLPSSAMDCFGVFFVAFLVYVPMS